MLKMSWTRIRLNSGFLIPVIGLGTYESRNPGEVENAVKHAIDNGYHHIDCAWIYGNEQEVGEAVRSKIEEKVITREDIFITTKVWNNFHRRKSVVEMLVYSLQIMRLSYVDLYLIHWPIGFKELTKTLPLDEGSAAYSDIDYLETWQGMEDCVAYGYARSIGVANFNSKQLRRILRHARIKPAVNHIECHPYMTQKKLIKFCHDHNIVVVGYCPLANIARSFTPGLSEPPILDEKILTIARKYRKTAAQVVLRFLIELGICLIPNTTCPERIREYINVFDFKLTFEDIKYLDSCNKNQRLCPFTAFADHKYYPFAMEE